MARDARAKTATNRVNAGDFSAGLSRMHNSCVTGLCMGCTQLMNKKLQAQEFH
jgi:hypothetical protein